MQSLRFSGSKGKLPLRLLSALAVTSSMLAGFSVMNAAQSSEGLILFGGVKSENRLSYTFDFGGEPNTIDRGRFRIPAKKMNLAAAQFAVSYPDYYEGTFNPKKIEVKVGGKKVPLTEVKWNKEARLLEIFPEEPVPAGKEVELVISDMRTPRFGGMYHFNCQILAPGDVPLLRYVGTWLLSIS
ncbi:DUF2808 domain-containing protein [Nodularia spumigena CS-584]|jgi:hypothetical protein|uniref:DUF2808 domain-containing protein n=3 Tax=Nodularia spumigena TaxID=70799 RepID=A0ABU5UVI4_NODSP|nr:DUF2808 domain-containing protein [Nodularia spumigena]AHJ29412.1 hypothetical protein NSP_30850 [Nodularia spumigena CCY9414]EAW46115.1 hypothetical protein N9414_00830 [Nodularia spumigena CCY9414]MDB9318962.1 DUF2808 domain-containing protein [Nodularia spumigena CS-590/01A]MDB9325064.1 DUF2808 domain-containing protein [Nodularia spumigena CS-590/02]MDB9383520.1 DUF2808 domain-containing protein [Nodularia spumigena CS-584]